MQHLFPAEALQPTKTSTSVSDRPPTRTASRSTTPSTEADQQSLPGASSIPDDSQQQSTDTSAFTRTASASEPEAWPSSRQPAQQQAEQSFQTGSSASYAQPTSQQQSFQRDSRMSYGQTAGPSDKWIGSSGKRAGKQLLATKGTRGPVTIKHMSWDAPSTSASPAEEEPIVQPQPERGRPRQSKLGPRPVPKTQQRQNSPQPETPPTPFSQSGTNAFLQPDGIPPHLPAPPASYPLPQPAYPAAAQSHPAAAAAPQASYPAASYPQTPAGQPRPNVQVDTSVNWQRMWTTEAADHNGDVIPTCLHLANMTDLPDNGEHAGLPHIMCFIYMWLCSDVVAHANTVDVTASCRT